MRFAKCSQCVQLVSVCIGRSDETRSLSEITAEPKSERVSQSAINVFNFFQSVYRLLS